mgnify:CR=1 FL=1
MDRFISKEAWGANPSKEATEDSHPIGSTLGVTFHWVGPHVGPFDHSECAGKVRGIDASPEMIEVATEKVDGHRSMGSGHLHLVDEA